MHDAKGRELKKGDVVVVPCVVTAISPSPGFCNVQLETVGGRLPDGNKERLSLFNTKQLLRANEADLIEIKTAVDDEGKEFLV